MSVRTAALALLVVVAVAAPAAAAPEGDVTWAVHISLAPTWFDPAETPSVITPFMVLYAMHDAMVKPMPGNPMAPSLAESWSVSKDGLVYDFVLRKGVRFHNGEPVTADDVKFSLERYRGGGATTLKARVAGVEAIDPQHVRIRLKQPWGYQPTSTPGGSASRRLPDLRHAREGGVADGIHVPGAEPRTAASACRGGAPRLLRPHAGGV